MNHDTDHLILAYLDGTLAPEEADRLNRLLLESADARARLRAFAASDARLRELAAGLPPEAAAEPVRAPAGWFDRVLLRGLRKPVAVGLGVGILGTSAVWAYVRPEAAATFKTLATLLSDGFESGPAPGNSGVPAQLDTWGGDGAVLCGAEQGIAPRHGAQMLRLLRSDYVGESSKLSHVGDQLRVIDLAAHREAIASGRALVTAEAWFNVVPARPGEEFAGGVQIYAFAHDPRLHRGQGWAAWYESHLSLSGEQQDRADSDPATWERVISELPLPTGTRFLVVHLRVNRTKPEPSVSPIEFPGAYVDDVSVQLLLRSTALAGRTPPIAAR